MCLISNIENEDDFCFHRIVLPHAHELKLLDTLTD